jgi:hypothetical protein
VALDPYSKLAHGSIQRYQPGASFMKKLDDMLNPANLSVRKLEAIKEVLIFMQKNISSGNLKVAKDTVEAYMVRRGWN